MAGLEKQSIHCVQTVHGSDSNPPAAEWERNTKRTDIEMTDKQEKKMNKRKIHDLLDIKECICISRRYCCAGRGRRRSTSQYGAWVIIVAVCVATFRYAA
ncbi:hypothetical protein KIN20_010177 [Parelaphostrongylus tenuis]|uniref:Uncharacterized protein n=1 Tax=Parelaphostrongylus tenuis TaxID=148309 RepID=A0AAD5MYP9_PARTN|nr:hypothetical protein KIN20_010177 [Parelaphostrongylus tenuis]